MFDDYVKAEAATDDNEELREPPSRRKVPANDLYSRVTAVDTYLLTGNKNKRQRRIGQIEEYYESLDTDLNAANKRDQPVLQDPWGWWQRVGRNRYPILFKIACDYLTIPCTSCDCERCFSSARRTITDDRNGLSGTTQTCQRYGWPYGLKASLINIGIQPAGRRPRKIGIQPAGGVAKAVFGRVSRVLLHVEIGGR